jgi:hypothetical protein
MASCIAYCDYIASLVRNHVLQHDTEHILFEVGPVRLDLAPSGALRSTTKVVNVVDRNGKKYRVTVEETNENDTSYYRFDQ